MHAHRRRSTTESSLGPSEVRLLNLIALTRRTEFPLTSVQNENGRQWRTCNGQKQGAMTAFRAHIVHQAVPSSKNGLFPASFFLALVAWKR